jgi:hypothetical protein
MSISQSLHTAGQSTASLTIPKEASQLNRESIPSLMAVVGIEYGDEGKRRTILDMILKLVRPYFSKSCFLNPVRPYFPNTGHH